MQRCFSKGWDHDTPCGFQNGTREGPAWSNNWNEVTCKRCLKHKPKDILPEKALHPNFDAVGFTSAITIAFFESLKGSANSANIDMMMLQNYISSFVASCEKLADYNEGSYTRLTMSDRG